jgi:predicted DNA-binding transcriptional regulator AlpA
MDARFAAVAIFICPWKVFISCSSGVRCRNKHEERMSRLESFEGLAALPALPDYAVLTKAQTCAVTNLSADTLDRLHRQKKGPPRVQLSERRVGYPAGGLRAWLKERAA